VAPVDVAEVRNVGPAVGETQATGSLISENHTARALKNLYREIELAGRAALVVP
jgi:hypothetical protein